MTFYPWVALSSLLGAGCFVDPAIVGSGPNGAHTATDSTTTASTNDAVGTATSAGQPPSSATETESTSVGSTADVGTGGTSAGSEERDCDCPENAILCEDFEEFGFEDPWVAAVMGAADPVPSQATAYCGETALRAEAPAEASWVQAVANLDQGMLVGSAFQIHAAVSVGPGCLVQGPIRVLDFTLGAQTPAYFASVWLAVDGVRLDIQDVSGSTRSAMHETDAVSENSWLPLVIDVDFDSDPPVVAITLDGDVLAVDQSSALEVGAPPSDFDAKLTLGTYRGSLFADTCTSSIDTVWIAPG